MGQQCGQFQGGVLVNFLLIQIHVNSTLDMQRQEVAQPCQKMHVLLDHHQTPRDVKVQHLSENRSSVPSQNNEDSSQIHLG
ncbi:uncharacterized protein ARMOST_18850 [Armillaria ostoyae]|uniref:Uncharacterized protein n=1 Tax=Armillaria ostoyae TaxID=47428 RepID=A0A284S320_ARMOS|nr:uncharacterized protein ARMOST_18850 [Armillaria ostoyae]